MIHTVKTTRSFFPIWTSLGSWIVHQGIVVYWASQNWSGLWRETLQTWKIRRETGQSSSLEHVYSWIFYKTAYSPAKTKMFNFQQNTFRHQIVESLFQVCSSQLTKHNTHLLTQTTHIHTHLWMPKVLRARPVAAQTTTNVDVGASLSCVGWIGQWCVSSSVCCSSW